MGVLPPWPSSHGALVPIEGCYERKTSLFQLSGSLSCCVNSGAISQEVTSQSCCQFGLSAKLLKVWTFSLQNYELNKHLFLIEYLALGILLLQWEMAQDILGPGFSLSITPGPFSLAHGVL